MVRLREAAEGLREDPVDGLGTGCAEALTLCGDAMPHRTAGASDAFEEAPLDHAGCQSAGGLIRLEGELREVVHRCFGVHMKVAQHVPLRHRETEGS